MGADVPKQFIPVCGTPILMLTIEAFHRADSETDIVVVLPEDCHERWHDLCRQHDFCIPHRIASGGETRFHSVRNGLSLLPDTEEALVAVHDGVRPFATKELIDRCFLAAEREGTAIPVIPVVETMRHTSPSGESQVVDRRDFCLVQTPQVFRLDILKQAFRQQFDPSLTDDAQVVEASGRTVQLVEGERTNIKITTPSDLTFAEYVCKQWT